MANSKKREFGYIRVSTSMRVESGYSLDDQENKIREHVEKQGYELVEIFRDEGKSGKNVSGRPQFQEMMRRVQSGEKIDYVIVTKLSRFVRNASSVMVNLEKMKSYNTNQQCISEPILLDSSLGLGSALLVMSSIFAQMEHETIREQTRAGRYEKARQGKWNGG
jgi:site-specific DNA recombinase